MRQVEKRKTAAMKEPKETQLSNTHQKRVWRQNVVVLLPLSHMIINVKYAALWIRSR